MQIERTRSRWWFLLPIILNIVGGVIAYFVLRHDDPSKAKNCLILGAALLAVSIATNMLFGVIAPEQMVGNITPDFEPDL